MRYALLAALLLFPAFSHAAELDIMREAGTIRVGDTFVVTLAVRTGGDSLNAIEGSVHFPSSALTLSDIRLAGSIIPLWISAPAERESGTISFAGVLPGGFQGTAGVATLVFTATRVGQVRISYGGDTKAYQNDGNGTPALLTTPALTFTVDQSLGMPRTAVLERDAVPPEPFVPTFVSGEPFGLPGTVLVFSTQDKDSGILRYDIARSYLAKEKETDLSWHEVQSPYVLEEGDGTRYLYVRAVDRSGNARIASVPPKEFSIIAFVGAYWLLLLAAAGVILFLRFSGRPSTPRAV